MTRRTVLLLFGGESPEHDVSLMSARNIYGAMDNSKYEVLLGYIDRHGKWWLLDSWQEDLSNHGGVQLIAALGSRSFVTMPGSNIIRPDIIYPALHGNNAEDGALQGLAQLLHVPIVGSSIAAHAICWDKHITKQLLRANDIAVVPWRYVAEYQPVPHYDEVVKTLQSQKLFVKPSQAGSSIGVSQVDTADKFTSAIAKALKYSPGALIEPAVSGRELEVAVLGNPPTHQTSGVSEIRPESGFYDYESKYDSSSQVSIIDEAELSSQQRQQIRTVASDAYRLLGCRGLARVDFFLADDGELYLNEVNTLPGFTSSSQYPKLWHHQGMRYPELIDKLIDFALH